MNQVRLKQKKIIEEIQSENSEKRFEALVENGLDCVIIISPEGKTTYVSRSVKNILGYSPEEVIDFDIRNLIHPDDLAGSESALVQTLENPGVPIQGYTSRIKHKNGTWRWIEPMITNLISDPSIRGIVDNFRDVTDRIRAEEELKTINERFILATKSSQLGIWDQDLENNVLIWDEAMYKIYGISDSNFKLTAKHWLTLIHEEDRHLMQEQVEKLLVDGDNFDLDFRIVLPDSSLRYIRTLAEIHRDNQGKPIRIIGTNIDITSIKEYQLTLEQILFDISHIIRRPVASILGLSRLIDEDNINSADLKQMAIYMKESAKELDNLINTLNDAYLKKKISAKLFSKQEA